MIAGFGAEHAVEVGRRLAEEHRVRRAASSTAGIRRRRRRRRRSLHRLRDAVEASPQHAASAEGQWLLDNDHLVEEALLQVEEDLPAAYLRQLPAVRVEDGGAEPRTLEIATSALEGAGGELDPAGLCALIEGYQQLAPLSMGELWALPSLLRRKVLEDLEGAGRALLAEPRPRPSTSIRTAILSLRRLAAFDWRGWFEEVSVVEHELRGDPADVYRRMDFVTRDRYRKAVEELGERDGARELATARAAVAASRERAAGSRESHVGHFLIDRGRAELAARLAPRRRPLAVPLARRIEGRPGTFYFGGIAVVAVAFLTVAVLGISQLGDGASGAFGLLVLAPVLLLLPALTLAISVVNWTVTRVLAPRPLPKLDLSEGIPPELRTLVVVPALLAVESEVGALLRRLQVNRLANRDPQLRFALLTDWLDAPEREMPVDRELLEAAVEGVSAINRDGGGQAPVLVLHRRRRWNPAQGCWMGWERKRGKLEELGRLLGGAEDTDLEVVAGDPAWLAGVRFVITLDADTQLPHDAARRLVATLGHPLNRARFAPAGDRVEAGYAVLQPRVEISPESANRTPLAQILAGSVGLDLYNRAVSDVYQDLFGEGLYAGKGIYEPRAFGRCLEGRVPENALLSHDLFEGLHARAGQVSDVTLLEEQPSHVRTHLARLHRWVRGDWQLLPWLLPRVPRRGGGRIPNRLGWLDRWKIVDNLRRSLVAPALLLVLLAGWTLLPGEPWLWTALAVGTLAVSLPLEALSLTWRVVRGGPWLHVVGESASALRLAAARLGFELMMLPAQAAVSLDAVARTLYRLAAGRRLLEWTSAARAEAIVGRRSRHRWLPLAPGPSLALGVALLLAVLERPWLPAAPFLLLWSVSPLLALRLSASRRPALERLPPARRHRLRRLARRTWHFFEVFVGPGDHWLPPDNHQEDPGPQTARRTSPTNVGLYLVSTFGAWDLGYLELRELVARLRNTLDTVAGVDRYRGHLWNWVSTENLAPLEPRYVSTVDSGNLAASLMAVVQGCHQAIDAPVPRRQALLGAADTVGVLREVLEEAAGDGRVAALAARLARLEERLRGGAPAASAASSAVLLEVLGDLRERELPEVEREVASVADPASTAGLVPQDVARARAFLERLHHGVTAWASMLEDLVGWARPLATPPELTPEPAASELAAVLRALRADLPAAPTLAELAPACRRARSRLPALRAALEASGQESSVSATQEVAAAGDWVDGLEAALARSEREADRLAEDLRGVARLAGGLADELELGFLYDRERSLFHLGFDAGSGRLDPHHYDLLVSEARLTSIVAIGRGEVPVEHWIHLGRPFARVAGARALVSWGGTAFEYLMPNLFLAAPPGTPLESSCRAAVRAQRAYSRSHRAPWGSSESGFHALGAHGWYQYRAFGVPGTGLKRGLGERLVIAPYASILALGLAPAAVDRNLDRLEGLGMLGRYGLFEAADYGSPRLHRRNPRARLVRSYMSHHQGMILASLANYLEGGTLRRRFRADPRVDGVEALLWEERRLAPLTHAWALEERAPSRRRAELPSWSVPVGDLWPQAQVLSNGRYRCMVTRDGGGGSEWRGIELTPWDADPTLDEQGCRIHLQDLESDICWSVDGGASGRQGEDLVVQFSAHRVELRCRVHGILAHLDICVAGHDDVEVRRLRLANESDRPRRLGVASYAEIALASPGERSRHPAFARLFVATEVVSPGILLFHRRPRGPAEEPVWIGWSLAPEPATGWEVERDRFLGRGGSRRAPRGLGAAGAWTSGERGVVATLDPVAVLRRTLELAPGERAELAVVAAAGPSRRVVLELLQRHRLPNSLEATFEEAQEQMARCYQELECAPEIAPVAQRLLSAVLFPHPELRAAPPTSGHDRLGLPALWGMGLSGDLPMVLVRLGPAPDPALLGELVRVHSLWRRQGVAVDLVLLDEEAEGYAWPLRDWLDGELERTGAMEGLQRPGGVFPLRGRELGAEQRRLLSTAAAVSLDGDAGDLAAQLAPLDGKPLRLPAFVPVPSAPPDAEAIEPLARPVGLRLDNGLGGFDDQGDYVVHLAPGDRTPAPWLNVISNPCFGFQVSESGAGSTWSLDSGERRLTPWSNDPVLDPPGEALYLRDEETGEVWSPMPGPRGADATYRVTHAPGLTRFRHRSHGLDQTVEVFAAREDPVKVVTVRLEDSWRRGRRITATYAAEWVLGSRRARTAPYLVTGYDAESQALLVHHSLEEGPARRTAFLVADRPPHGFTTDRTELLGRGGSRARPAALWRIGLTDSTDGAGDPCGVLQVHLECPPSGVALAHFVLGEGESRRRAIELATRFRDPEEASAARRDTLARWDGLASALQVSTPEPELDALVNRWLPYQSLSCRMWGRGAFYQAGGAFGFRDQLQDACALLALDPGLARAQILEAAARQFEAGDVLHWWHPRSARGVRSRCSDDLVWLPWSVLEYLEVTDDQEILDLEAPFLAGPELAEGESERYDTFAAAGTAASLFEHCVRALERASTRGSHGLPLIGSCDWNDALSRVGDEGRGESVWLAWFLGSVSRRFATLCDERGDRRRGASLRSAADGYREAAERHAWDGDWYLRAFDDEGAPLGSSRAIECRIDLLVQSWAVLSGEADSERATAAMRAAHHELVERGPDVVRLLTPPFGGTGRDPGYIRAYPPGVRENGGQYNHAAVWAAWAWTVLGDGDRALELERMINPLNRARDRPAAERYRLEPYAVAGDVCASPPLRGRGGWSWYTGSAGWLYRLVVEAMLGIRRRGDRVTIAPCIPSDWPGFEASLRYGASTYRIRVDNPERISHGVERVLVDGAAREGADTEGVALADDGEVHLVTVRLGRRRSGAEARPATGSIRPGTLGVG